MPQGRYAGDWKQMYPRIGFRQQPDVYLRIRQLTLVAGCAERFPTRPVGSNYRVANPARTTSVDDAHSNCATTDLIGEAFLRRVEELWQIGSS